MEQLKTQKVNVVVDQFEHQLIKEAAQEEKKYNERLSSDHETKLQQLTAEKSTALKDISQLEQQLNDQIRFFAVILKELQTKRDELESSHSAAVH